MGVEDSKQVTWADLKKDGESSSSSINDNSDPSSSSFSSSSSSDLTDDATSSSSSSALYEFAELIAQLPIKRGLSKFYNGKSRTFADLACVVTVKDLAKEERLKSCKSYGSNLNRRKFGPKPTIVKRSSSPKGTFCSFN